MPPSLSSPIGTTISSREFNRDVSRAKRAAESGPVLITDRGQPAYVLLRIEAYRRLTGDAPRMSELLDQPEGGDIEFDPPRFGATVFRAPDLA